MTRPSFPNSLTPGLKQYSRQHPPESASLPNLPQIIPGVVESLFRNISATEKGYKASSVAHFVLQQNRSLVVLRISSTRRFLLTVERRHTLFAVRVIPLGSVSCT
jgi:hypothetical protein